MEDEKKTPDEWLEHPDYEGIEILDPDGWDRQNFEESWAELLTKHEFFQRMIQSTCSLPSAFELKKS